jgi:large subunit ribosomal protein L13
MLEKKPTEIIKHAVKGMVQTRGPLGRTIVKKLFVYAGAEHPHSAQKPEVYKA